VVLCVTGFGESSHVPIFETLQLTGTEKRKGTNEKKEVRRKKIRHRETKENSEKKESKSCERK